MAFRKGNTAPSFGDATGPSPSRVAPLLTCEWTWSPLHGLGYMGGLGGPFPVPRLSCRFTMQHQGTFWLSSTPDVPGSRRFPLQCTLMQPRTEGCS